ncbi:hypothetical protein H072_594 [Dactylellina haptotyla CBS 200.50]|uniref:Rhodopsin domain-containing protein n=1 Tax=Dactylellina haptotyla (strain CBS 200.50) TaxID=1284197 RepID=S8AQZ9_DACHA|nr:hypothetical protein H072_594 [Dactylellina haptotyla CBS 200.50]
MVNSNSLAEIGIALQYDFGAFFNNVTAVNLAAEVCEAVRNNVLYLGTNITELVSSYVGQNLTDSETIQLLDEFKELDHDRWPLMAVPLITLTILGGIFVIIRTFTRIKYCGGLKNDDWLLIAGYLCSLVSNTEDLYVAIAANWPAHIWDKTLWEARIHRMLGTLDGYSWYPGKCLVMFSLLLFYHDLYPGRLFQVSCYFCALLTFVWAAAGMLMTQLPCTPHDSWNYLRGFNCISNYVQIFRAHTIFSIVIDILMLLLPVFIVWRLRASVREKVALAFLFGLGSVVVVMAFLRQQSFIYYGSSSDLSWRSIPATTWTCAELQTAIICASIPATRKFFVDIGSQIGSHIGSLGSRISLISRSRSSNAGSSTEGSSSARSRAGSYPASVGHSPQSPKRGFWSILASSAEKDDADLELASPVDADKSVSKDTKVAVKGRDENGSVLSSSSAEDGIYKGDLESGTSSTSL